MNLPLFSSLLDEFKLDDEGQESCALFSDGLVFVVSIGLDDEHVEDELPVCG